MQQSLIAHYQLVAHQLYFMLLFLIFNLTFVIFFFNIQASSHNKNLDVGANIFIGNLDPEIDEKLLYDTFSAFGVILQTPKVGFGVYIRQNVIFFIYKPFLRVINHKRIIGSANADVCQLYVIINCQIWCKNLIRLTPYVLSYLTKTFYCLL